MKFYTSVNLVRNQILLRGYRDGQRIQESIPYKPSVFITSKTGNTIYRNLQGQPVDRLEFDSINDARDFMNTYKDVSGMTIYGLNKFVYTFIHDEYPGEIGYDPALINVCNIDIEVASDKGFPDISLAQYEVTAITMKVREKYVVFGCGDFVNKDPNVKYIKCADEHALLSSFLTFWNSKEYSPDVVTGWNIEFFDIPYLVNRIRNVLGDKDAKRLSPWQILEEYEVTARGNTVTAYRPLGIAVLDYVQLYKKFTFVQQESYSLNNIAQVELGEGKLDYSQYESLIDLYKNDYQTFIEYNIKDVDLVGKLDDKLKLIELVFALAYNAKINFGDTFASVNPWDVIIYNYLMDQRIVIPQMPSVSGGESIIGGFVKEPIVGMHKWVVSFDLNSLYPHLIMQYNISPETFVKRLPYDISIDQILSGGLKDVGYEYRDNDCAIAANLCMYRRDKQGFLPRLMETMYDDRSVYKKKMIEAKKAYENCADKNSPEAIQLDKDISRYHNLQMAKKIQLNSAYGALANQYFRWYDLNHAEAITASGQLAIRWMEQKMNIYFNKVLNTKGVDYVIACDTDSMYLSFDRLVDHVYAKKETTPSDLEISRFLDKVCTDKIEPYIDKCYAELADYVNAFSNKMKMKREAIAAKGIWIAKKRYILNVYNLEGVEYHEPKLKMQGIEAVRSSTPASVRENIKKALSIIMNKSQGDLHQFIEQFREDFMKLPFEDVAFPRGVKGLRKYSDAAMIYQKGTPIHVKGALLYNKTLEKKGLANRYPMIYEGDKIKFAYLKMPNPLHDTVISVPGILPKQLGLDAYVDHSMQFEKTFLDPIKSITDAIGWHTEQTLTLEDFFG